MMSSPISPRAGWRQHASKALLLCLTLSLPAVAITVKAVDYADIAKRVADMLGEEHFIQQPFDDEMSSKALDAYIEYLDYGRVYFTQEDIDQFNTNFRTTLDDKVAEMDIQPAYDIYALYKSRVKERVAKIKELLEEETFTFEGEREVEMSRKDADWPANQAEADKLWHDIIESEMLNEELARLEREKEKAEKAAADTAPEAPHTSGPNDPVEGKTNLKIEPLKDQGGTLPPEESKGLVTPGQDPADLPPAEPDAEEDNKTPQEKILERYDRILESVRENDADDVAAMFIKAISRAYDPHSEYFSPPEYENFKIGMNKKLEGIGAILSLQEDGYAEIQGLVVGGPAHRSGQLQIKDKISGVAQGRDGEMVEVVHKKLSDIVDLIRGAPNSIVRLKLIPADAVDPSQSKVISIVRDQVDLKDSLASAELIETQDAEGNPQRLGWIRLLSFYSDMDGGETSTTADVQRLLNRLKREKIDGVVLDLRDNGGGSLEEAINLTGLFIPRGPVVQSKDWRDNIDPRFSRNLYPVYEGPLVVLTNRASASASEILAAALQDYNRALIVGDQATFGKGTVQQLRPVQAGRSFFSFGPPQMENGALKLTIQKFYRIAGNTTQLKGVVPDIILPSPTDAMDIGESALPNPLGEDSIAPQDYEATRPSPFPIKALTTRSEARVAEDRDFNYVEQDVARALKRIEENTISLNLEERLKEREEAEARRDAREEERKARYAEIRKEEEGLFTVYALTQDNVNDEGLRLRSDISKEESSGMIMATPEDDEEAKALEPPHEFDPVKRETIHILQDLIAGVTESPGVDISGTNGSTPAVTTPARPAPAAPATGTSPN